MKKHGKVEEVEGGRSMRMCMEKQPCACTCVSVLSVQRKDGAGNTDIVRRQSGESSVRGWT